MIETIKYYKGNPDLGPLVAMLESAERDWGMVLVQPNRPVVDGEFNLLQQVMNSRIRNVIRAIYGVGGILNSITPSGTGLANEVRLHTVNQAFWVVIDGISKILYTYDDPQDVSSRIPGGNRVRLPAYTGAPHDELVYLEVWFEEVKPVSAPGTASSILYQNGMVGNFTLTNDIAIPTIPLSETSRRVQLRAQIKVLPNGNNLNSTLAKGVSGYLYQQIGTTTFYKAGLGTQADGAALNAVDGVVFGIPLLRIARNAAVVANGDITIVTPLLLTNAQMSNIILNYNAAAVPVTPQNGISSTNVQAALEELQTELNSVSGGGSGTAAALAAHISSGSAHAASNITYSGAPNIAAGSVESGIDTAGSLISGHESRLTVLEANNNIQFSISFPVATSNDLSILNTGNGYNEYDGYGITVPAGKKLVVKKIILSGARNTGGSVTFSIWTPYQDYNHPSNINNASYVSVTPNAVLYSLPGGADVHLTFRIRKSATTITALSGGTVTVEIALENI